MLTVKLDRLIMCIPISFFISFNITIPIPCILQQIVIARSLSKSFCLEKRDKRFYLFNLASHASQRQFLWQRFFLSIQYTNGLSLRFNYGRLYYFIPNINTIINENKQDIEVLCNNLF